MVGNLRRTPICWRGLAAKNQTRDHEFIGSEARTRQEIEIAFGLKENLAELHLALLEKADMIEKIDGFYRSTTIGSAYIKNFEAL
jgi:hypothetical protein